MHVQGWTLAFLGPISTIIGSTEQNCDILSFCTLPLPMEHYEMEKGRDMKFLIVCAGKRYKIPEADLCTGFKIMCKRVSQ